MPIPAKTASIISTASLLGLLAVPFGSCAYVDHKVKSLNPDLPGYVEERQELNSQKYTLFGVSAVLFMTTYFIGAVAVERRRDEEKEIKSRLEKKVEENPKGE